MREVNIILVLTSVLLTAWTTSIPSPKRDLLLPHSSGLNATKRLEKRFLYVDMCDSEMHRLLGVDQLVRVSMKEKADSDADQFVVEINEIRAAVEELLRLFTKIKSSVANNAVTEPYAQLKKAANEIKSRLEQKFQNAKKNVLSCGQQELYETETEVEELQRKMEKLLEELKNSFEVISLIVGIISQGDISAAKQLFATIENESLLANTTSPNAVINCIQEMTDFQSTIQQFIIISNKTTSLSSSADEYIKLHRTSEETRVRLQQQLVNAQFKNIACTKETTNAIEGILNEIFNEQELRMQKQNEAMLKRQWLSWTVRYIISEEKFDLAVQNILILGNDTSVIDQVIKMAYNSTVIPKVLKFIEKLPLNTQRISAINTLSSEVENTLKTNASTDLLANNLESLLALPNDSDEKNGVSRLAGIALDIWAQQIQSKNFKSITDFANKHSSKFQNYITHLLKRAYEGNDEAIVNILALATEFNSPQHRIFVIDELYKLMKVTRSINKVPIGRFAYELKGLMNSENFKGEKRVREMWDELPLALKQMVSNNYIVCIKNIGGKKNTNLSVKSHDEHQLGADVVKCKIHGWLFEPVQREGKLHFYIKRYMPLPRINEYLFASNVVDNSTYERRTYTSKQHIEGDTWDAEDYDWDNGTFILRNTHYNEYLHSSGSDFQAYTWGKKTLGLPLWKIDTTIPC